MEKFLGDFLRLQMIRDHQHEHKVPIYKRGFALRQLMAVLLGGFFFEYRTNSFVNTFHFYFFLFLFFFPFALVQIAGPTNIPVLVVDLVVILLVFSLIKIINHLLHEAFNGAQAQNAKGKQKLKQREEKSPDKGKDFQEEVKEQKEKDLRISSDQNEIEMKPTLQGSTTPTEETLPQPQADVGPSKLSEEKPSSSSSKRNEVPDEFGQEISIEPPPPRRSRGGGRRSQATSASSESAPKRTSTALQPSPTRKEEEPPQFHLFNLSIPLNFRRHELEVLFDRDLSIWEAVLSVCLATLTAGLGLWMLQFYNFIVTQLLFCLTIAGAQYCLVKSVQPDASSPEFANRVVIYSRATYFCILSILILILDASLSAGRFVGTSSFYGITVDKALVVEYIVEGFRITLLCFPAIFAGGLLPHVVTFFNYCMEQGIIHGFGGTGTLGPAEALTEFLRAGTGFGILVVVHFLISSYESADIFEPGWFSFFCGLVIGLGYLFSCFEGLPGSQLGLSRFLNWLRNKKVQTEGTREYSPTDFLMDLFTSFLLVILGTILHISTICNYELTIIIVGIIAIAVGIVTRDVFLESRKMYPFRLFAHPILVSPEHSQYEVHAKSTLSWFETFTFSMRVVEQVVIYPIIIVSALTQSHEALQKFGLSVASFVIALAGFKLAKLNFTDVSQLTSSLMVTLLLFHFDLKDYSETFLLDLFFVTIFMAKWREFALKAHFVTIYSSPWNLSWGSVFHAVVHPLSFPHLVFCIIQMGISSLISSPFYPLGGSTAFFISYPRPYKYWERHYKTNRLDDTNTKLGAGFEGSAASSLNNLNSIFYEHLVNSLRRNLYEDLSLGRWGDVKAGDIFIMTNDRLTSIIHIIQYGNGFVSFQLRGLEFKGTYCQERELEAINDSQYKNSTGFMCFRACGPLPHFLSLNSSIALRWNSWEIMSTDYVLQTYSISLNPAKSFFMVFSLRASAIRYFVMAAIYNALKSPGLASWLANPGIEPVLQNITPQYVDFHPMFNIATDVDFDDYKRGVSFAKFFNAYGPWIRLCLQKRTTLGLSEDQALPSDDFGDSLTSPVVRFCFILSLLCRRTLAETSSAFHYSDVDSFLFAYASLFRGEVRVNSVEDEWVLNALEILDCVTSAIRLSLKLQQDDFALPGEYNDLDALYDAIKDYQSSLTICHEGDPNWRKAVLEDQPSLLSIRKTQGDRIENPEYQVLTLNLRYSKFTVVKVNKEGVRGMWAAQQQELIFYGNQNEERGSIQQMRSVLRNLMTQSCDLPVGYPIYISPITTSYSPRKLQETLVQKASSLFSLLPERKPKEKKPASP